MFTLYTIGFFSSLFALVLWYRFSDEPKAGRLLSLILFGALGVYLTGWLGVGESWSFKFQWLSRDLLFIAATGFVFSRLSKRPGIFISGLIAIGLVSVWFFFSFIQPGVLGKQEIDRSHLAPEGELLVELKEGADEKVLQWAQKELGLDISTAFAPADSQLTTLDNYYLIDVPNDGSVDQAIRRLMEVSAVVWVEPNEQIQVAPNPGESPERINKKFGLNDPAISELWAFDQMNMDQLYNYMEKNKIPPKKKALVAIIDTGVDAGHEDLKENFKSIKSKYDTDPRGHGTHCAGIAGAVSNNGKGIASFSRDNTFVQVTSVRVLNNFGMGTQQTIIQGMIEATDAGADVLSLSLGGISNQSRQRAYEKAVAYAHKKKAIVVAAAGNSNRNARDFSPVNAKGVIGVSAVDQELNKAEFSNYVEDLSQAVAAPGVGIYSTVPNNEYAVYNGTSMATPYVSGLIGLLRSIDPNLDSDMAYTILHKTGKATRNPQQTGRFIQPREAVEALVNR